MPCPRGDRHVILATRRMSSGLSSSFPSVTSATISAMVGRARQRPSQTPRGRCRDQKGWGVCPCSDGVSLLLLLPPESTSWEFPKMCHSESRWRTWEDELRPLGPLPPSRPRPLVALDQPAPGICVGCCTSAQVGRVAYSPLDSLSPSKQEVDSDWRLTCLFVEQSAWHSFTGCPKWHFSNLFLKTQKIRSG